MTNAAAIYDSGKTHCVMLLVRFTSLLPDCCQRDSRIQG
jgi:hypothetical protein